MWKPDAESIQAPKSWSLQSSVWILWVAFIAIFNIAYNKNGEETSMQYTVANSVLLEFNVLIKARIYIQRYIRGREELNAAFERFH